MRDGSSTPTSGLHRWTPSPAIRTARSGTESEVRFLVGCPTGRMFPWWPASNPIQSHARFMRAYENRFIRDVSMRRTSRSGTALLAFWSSTLTNFSISSVSSHTVTHSLAFTAMNAKPLECVLQNAAKSRLRCFPVARPKDRDRPVVEHISYFVDSPPDNTDPGSAVVRRNDRSTRRGGRNGEKNRRQVAHGRCTTREL